MGHEPKSNSEIADWVRSQGLTFNEASSNTLLLAKDDIKEYRKTKSELYRLMLDMTLPKVDILSNYEMFHVKCRYGDKEHCDITRHRNKKIAAMLDNSGDHPAFHP